MKLLLFLNFFKRLFWKLFVPTNTSTTVTEPPSESVDCSCSPLFDDNGKYIQDLFPLNSEASNNIHKILFLVFLGHPPDLHRALRVFRETAHLMDQLSRVLVEKHCYFDGPFPTNVTLGIIMHFLSYSSKLGKKYATIGATFIERRLQNEPVDDLYVRCCDNLSD